VCIHYVNSPVSFMNFRSFRMIMSYAGKQPGVARQQFECESVVVTY